MERCKKDFFKHRKKWLLLEWLNISCTDSTHTATTLELQRGLGVVASTSRLRLGAGIKFEARVRASAFFSALPPKPRINVKMAAA